MLTFLLGELALKRVLNVNGVTNDRAARWPRPPIDWSLGIFFCVPARDALHHQDLTLTSALIIGSNEMLIAINAQLRIFELQGVNVLSLEH